MKKLGLSLLILGLFIAGLAVNSDEYVTTQNNPELGTYLTNLNGQSLYTFMHDEPIVGISACEGDCAAIWPPYLVDDPDITLQEGFAGELSTIVRSDGAIQLTYNGWPLYTYAADLALGDVNGHGASDVWSLAFYGEPLATEAEMPTDEMIIDEAPTDEIITDETPNDLMKPNY